MSFDEEREIEKASLLPGRYYIVMRADEDNNFNITAYDTTDEEFDERQYLETGEVILNGLMELIENDFERVGHAGLARINFNATREYYMEAIEDEESEVQVENIPDSNIVKVRFGRKQ